MINSNVTVNNSKISFHFDPVTILVTTFLKESEFPLGSRDKRLDICPKHGGEFVMLNRFCASGYFNIFTHALRKICDCGCVSLQMQECYRLIRL